MFYMIFSHMLLTDQVETTSLMLVSKTYLTMIISHDVM